MKKKNPLISIIVNCFNGEKYLKDCIKSIINQSYKNWEVIFWNNASTDSSRNVLKKFKDKRIKYFKSNKFLNLYDARNQAIKKANGEFISFLDTDDWWVKDKLSTQIELINNNKNINFIYSNVFIYNEKTKKKELYFKNKKPSGKITQSLLDDYKIGILTVMMKKKLFSGRKFNKSYNIIGDFDFFLNLSIEENFYCIQKPLAYHRRHENNFSKKINIFSKELDKWLKINDKKLKNLNYSLKSFKFWYYKLKIKKLLGWGL
tara:strand:- start:2133 stop:2915 length:783 start_codon:yes stop_codon:yes gene_type:complete